MALPIAAIPIIISAAQALLGSSSETKTSKTGTESTRVDISDAGVNKLIQDILAGPGGVKSIGGAGRQTGLFNSTTEDMLLGDLFSRAAVSAELARSPTITTFDTQTQSATEDPGLLGGLSGGNAFSGLMGGKSVICTAFMEKGLVSKELHAKGNAYFQKLSPVTKTGYWMWGTWVAKKIRAGSVFWTKLTLPVVKSYLRYVGGASAWAEPLGAVAHYLGEPICKALGKAAIYFETKIKARA